MPGSPPDKQESGGVIPAAAGATGGTALIAVIATLSDDNPYKPWLLLATPALTVGLSGVFWFCKRELIRYGRRRQVKGVVGKITEALSNPLTSAAHKRKMREKLEAIEFQEIQNTISELQNIAPLGAMASSEGASMQSSGAAITNPLPPRREPS